MVLFHDQHVDQQEAGFISLIQMNNLLIQNTEMQHRSLNCTIYIIDGLKLWYTFNSQTTVCVIIRFAANYSVILDFNHKLEVTC